MSNSFDPDQVRRFVGPDLGQNCLLRLSTDDTNRVRVYEDNPNKVGSRIDRVNRGSTFNFKITNWEIYTYS